MGHNGQTGAAGRRCMLALVLVAVFCGAGVRAAPTTVKVCVPYSEDVTSGFLRDCTAKLAPANNKDVEFTCVKGGSPDECLLQLDSGDAHLTALDGGDVLRSNKLYGVEPLVMEKTGDKVPGGTYYAVAVVRKEFCTFGVSLSDLKGTRSCHTGFRKTAGWKIPVGTLFNDVPDFAQEGTQNNIEDDAELVARFFDETCAPRTSGNGPRNGLEGEGQLWDDLCEGCKGDCTTNDQYYDYSGAFRCLSEGAGDVAFVKHSTVLEFASDGTADATERAWSDFPKSDFRLLCRDGGCADVEDYKDCHLALAPGHAIVAAKPLGYKGDAAELGLSIQNALVKAASDPEFLAGTVAMNKNFLFSSSTTGVQEVTRGMKGYITEESVESFEAFDRILLQTLEEKIGLPEVTDVDVGDEVEDKGLVATMCTKNEQEANFCFDVSRILSKVNPEIKWACHKEASSHDCLEAVSRGTADYTSVDGADAYLGFANYGLRVVVGEDKGTGLGTNYYAVAVVKKEFCTDGVTLEDLKGKRSCHTGYRKNAGWQMPVGMMITRGFMPVVDDSDLIENDAESISSFFSQTCAPRISDNGPQNSPDGKGQKWEPLCGGCKGDCSNKDQYYNYGGAFKCLVEDDGDVAFVKHTTVTDELSDELSLYTDKSPSDFKLLCSDRKGCHDVSAYSTCNVARVPSHSVVTTYSSLLIKNNLLQNALVKASKTSEFKDLVFNKDRNPDNLVFSNSAQRLIRIDSDTATFLGDSAEIFRTLRIVRETPEKLADTVSVQATDVPVNEDNAGGADNGAAGANTWTACILSLLAGFVMYLV